jgi:hypothetical protein
MFERATAVGIAALLMFAGLSGLTVSGAAAAVPPSAAAANGAAAARQTEPPMTTAEAVQATIVAQFESTHPWPIVNASAPPATFERQNDAAYAYWLEAPIPAMYAQWGCTVRNVEVSKQLGGDGLTRATLGLVSHCPAGVGGIHEASFMFPRKADPALAYEHCSTHNAYCISAAGTSSPLATTFKNVLTSDFRGHVTAGMVGPSAPCGIGTNLGSTSNTTVAPGDSISEYTRGWRDGTHSATSVYSNGSKRGDYCYTF